jgi:pyridoxamine 5'-phosphate oxidase family protein
LPSGGDRRKLEGRRETMSVFTDAELRYLKEHKLGRLATADRGSQPHITPVTYTVNEAENSIDLGGLNFGESKKWRDMQENPRVAFLVDDVIGPPRQARAVEVRGDAELHETGGESINPRFSNFDPRFVRIRPTRIVSWGIEEAATAAAATSGATRARGRDVSRLERHSVTGD